MWEDKKMDTANTTFLDIECELTKLFLKYGSDKGYLKNNTKSLGGWTNHNYSLLYNLLFNHCRNNIQNVFELGLGTNNPNVLSNMSINGKPGASLRAWRDYFPNANIYGGDIDETVLFEEERIKTYKVDQLDEKSIKKMWNNIGDVEFDFILDDGAHTYEATTNFFSNSFHKLRKNGLYIIEDITKNKKPIENEQREYLTSLMNYLKHFKPTLFELKNSKIEQFNKYHDNNVIIIKKYA